MRNSLTSHHQRDSHTINETDINVMSNSMALLFIYHGPKTPDNKQLINKNENNLHKIAR